MVMAKIQHNHRHQDVNTASAVRLGIFQPTRRPVTSTWQAETRWGSATITGRLGQRHVDFLECCRMVAESQGLDGAGRFCCVVDPNKLRTAMSQGRARLEWSQMRDLADDLRTCKISDLRITAHPNFGVVTAGVLDSVLFDNVGKVPTRRGTRLEGVVVKEGVVIRPGRAAQAGEGRELWKVAFSEAWTALVGADLPISYRGHLSQIISLRRGASQAVARFMLSHMPGASYSLDEALRIVGVAPAVLRHRRRDVQEDAEALAEAGVHVVDGKIFTLAGT